MRDTDPPPKRPVDWPAIGLLALGLLCLWIAATELPPTFRAIAGRAPIVEFRPSYLIPVPLAVSLLALASGVLIPRRQGRSRSEQREHNTLFWRRATRLFYIAGAGAIVAAAIAPVGQWVIGSSLADRGYERCPPSELTRRPPQRWHLPGAPCPD